MAGGYAGKILRVNLTTRAISTIDTEQYSDKFFGQMGIQSAIFFDLAPKEPLDGLDPRNVISGMTGPLNGTITPYSGGRFNWTGVAPHSYGKIPSVPGMFSRSGHGGRIGGELKRAGWDGIVIEGVADSPVWLNIVNDQVTIEDASDLWGKGNIAANEEIWRRATGAGLNFSWGEWRKFADGSYTTQRPAIVSIGQGGETPGGRIGGVQHGDGRNAGEGGYGSALGAKKLKAISVTGTGTIPIDDPEALLDARLRYNRDWMLWKVDEPRPADLQGQPSRSAPAPNEGDPRRIGGHCEACPGMCTGRRASGISNNQRCNVTSWYSMRYGNNPGRESGWYSHGHPNYVDEKTPVVPVAPKCASDPPTNAMLQLMAQTAMDNYGMDSRSCRNGLFTTWLLYAQGRAGPGGPANGFEFNTDPLPMDKWGTLEFVRAYLKAIAYRQGIGEWLSQGMSHGLVTLGLFEEGMENGYNLNTSWGYEFHHSWPNVEWCLSDLVTDRDNNEHLCPVNSSGSPARLAKYGHDANWMVQRASQDVIPYNGDPFMFDYTWQELDGSKMAQALETGIYSQHMAKMVAWYRHYGNGYTQTAPFCCGVGIGNHWTMSGAPPDYNGRVSDWLPDFVKAVTGKNISWADQIDTIGRRVHNMRRVIHVLQGRHRNEEVFPGWWHRPMDQIATKTMTAYNPATGQWEFKDFNSNYALDRAGVEAWKTHYYKFEGWDEATGWPTRATLEDLDLKDAADALQAAGRLGAPGNRYVRP